MKLQGIEHILIGFVMVVFGAVVPFLMVLQIINLSLWLSILSYSASVVGLFIGVFGAFEIHQDELDK
jgi:hypothetical protein